MQITLKLRGVLKIAFFFLVTIVAITYAGYKAYRYITYKKVISATSAKRIRNFQRLPFSFTMNTCDSTDRGYLLLAPHVRFNLKYGSIVIMDLSGHLLFQKLVDGAVIDLRQWKLNGHTYYSYGVDDSATNHVNLSAGHIVVCDSALNEIKQIHLLPYDDITINNKEDLDLHDFIMLSEDHYISMAVCKKNVNNIPVCLLPAPGVKVATAIMQEVKDGKVIWQWDATHHPEFYLNSDLGNSFYDSTATQDYIHINSMIFDPADSNLIVSFRHQNQVVKINRHSGDIIWRLGGKSSDFPLTKEQLFLRQHNIVLTDNNQTLMIFDNGEKFARPSSRVIEFKLDEKSKTVVSFKAYNIPEPFSESLGSVQKIGDDYLICGGTANYVLLVNSITGAKKMEIKMNQASYRAWLVYDITGINLNEKVNGRK